MSVFLGSVNLSLPDTKLAEDHVQNVFDVDATEQPAKRCACRPQLLCSELLAFVDHVERSPQRRGRVLQQSTLPCAGDESRVARTEIGLSKSDNCTDQIRNAITA